MAAEHPLLVVFDLDGTLADTAADLIGALNVVLRRENVAPLPVAVARSMVGAGARALITRGLAAAGRDVSPDRMEQLFAEFLGHYEMHIADQSRLFPGAAEALDRLAAAGHRLAVCTNKIGASAVRLLTALGVADRFAAICGQDTFAVAKPDPAALYLTIERAQGSVSRTIMVGDSKTDIDTARAACVPVVAVDFGYTDVHVSRFDPDRVISHFAELDAAICSLLDRPREAGKPAHA